MALVIFDTETGGLESHHPTTQIAAVAVDDVWNPLEEFEQKLLFDPDACEPDALKLNGYNQEVWGTQAVLERVGLERFARFLSRHADCEKMSARTGRPYKVARLCGHNIATFDLPRMQAAFKRHGLFLPAAFNGLCTVQLYRWARHVRPELPESGKLSDICSLYGAHDALVDCHLTRQVAPRILSSLLGGQ